MRLKLLLLPTLILCIKVYSLEVNIIDISYQEKYFQIDIEISSDGTALIPETALQEKITTDINPLTGNEYQVFYAFLIASGLSDDRFVLVVSNENIGITQYLGRLHTVLLTRGVSFIPFSGKRPISIIINRVKVPIANNKTNFIIEEVFLNYCYSTDMRIKEREFYRNSGDKLSLEDVLRISSVAYRLSDPIFYSKN
jgi:hypothetical protein